MDFKTNDIIKIIAATVSIVTLAVTIANAIYNYLKFRTEHKLNREKFVHERRKWAENLNHDIEKELIPIRIEKYPQIISALKKLIKAQKRIQKRRPIGVSEQYKQSIV